MHSRCMGSFSAVSNFVDHSSGVRFWLSVTADRSLSEMNPSPHSKVPTEAFTGPQIAARPLSLALFWALTFSIAGKLILTVMATKRPAASPMRWLLAEE